MESCYEGKYKQLQRIGSGAYGVVYKVRCIATGKIYTAKRIALHLVAQQTAMKEFNNLRRLQHPYIVKLIESFVSEDELVIIMEYCGEKDLSYHIEAMRKQQKHFTESLVGTWIMQLVLAIEFMHKKNVLHRDLKPQNLFVDEDMNLKIGDFGISKALESSLETCKTSIGTPCYMAPEMYTTDRYNNKADIWSLGCVVYEICALEKLFPMRDKEDKVVGIFKIMESIKEGRMREVPSIYSEGIRKLVKKMLTRDPEKRPSAAKLLEDKLILQVMINNSSQVNLKKEYSMGLEKPLLSQSFVDRQTEAVSAHLRKFEEEIKCKMDGMKKQKLNKEELEKYYKQMRRKMQEVEKAVKSAFRELKKESQIEQSFEISTDDPSETSIEKGAQGNKVNQQTKMEQQDESDLTINSIDLSQNNQLPSHRNLLVKEKNILESVQSTQSAFEPSQLESSIYQTITEKTLRHNESLNPVEKGLNKLQQLQQTLRNDPHAVLNQSYLNCTLSLSGNDFSFSQFKGTMNFELTTAEESSREISKKQSLEAMKEDSEGYSEDFETFQDDESAMGFQDSIRKQQMNTIVSLFQETLLQTSQEGRNTMNTTTESQRIKRKYLVMSEIKEQSSQGGSMMSHGNDSL